MAKKKSVKKPVEVKEVPVGYINLALYVDGSYDLDTEINPAHLAIYANMLADILEGKINETIIQRYAMSDLEINQQIAIFLNSFLKLLKTNDKPVIMPDKVFRKNKSK